MVKACFKMCGIVLLAAIIPLLLVVDTIQSKKYVALQKEVRQLDKNQYEVIELNKRLVTNISILSSPERIETLAIEVLNMRKAQPEEIIRIEVKGKKVGG